MKSSITKFPAGSASRGPVWVLARQELLPPSSWQAALSDFVPSWLLSDLLLTATLLNLSLDINELLGSN